MRSSAVNYVGGRSRKPEVSLLKRFRDFMSRTERQRSTVREAEHIRAIHS